jgi:hypothetical protein
MTAPTSTEERPLLGVQTPTATGSRTALIGAGTYGATSGSDANLHYLEKQTAATYHLQPNSGPGKHYVIKLTVVSLGGQTVTRELSITVTPPPPPGAGC